MENGVDSVVVNIFLFYLLCLIYLKGKIGAFAAGTLHLFSFILVGQLGKLIEIIIKQLSLYQPFIDLSAKLFYLEIVPITFCLFLILKNITTIEKMIKLIKLNGNQLNNPLETSFLSKKLNRLFKKIQPEPTTILTKDSYLKKLRQEQEMICKVTIIAGYIYSTFILFLISLAISIIEKQSFPGLIVFAIMIYNLLLLKDFISGRIGETEINQEP